MQTRIGRTLGRMAPLAVALAAAACGSAPDSRDGAVPRAAPAQWQAEASPSVADASLTAEEKTMAPLSCPVPHGPAPDGAKAGASAATAPGLRTATFAVG